MTPVEHGSEYYCCLFCFKTFCSSSIDDSLRSEMVQDQFFRNLRRHLLEENLRLDTINPLSATASESVKEFVVPCTECLEVIKSYCEYYEQVKLLKMKLNWRLWTLTNIISSSEEVTFRRRFFQEKIAKMNVDDGSFNATDFFQSVGNFRKELVKKGYERIRTCFPKILVNRWTPIRKIKRRYLNKSNQEVTRKLRKSSQHRPASVVNFKRKRLLSNDSEGKTRSTQRSQVIYLNHGLCEDGYEDVRTVTKFSGTRSVKNESARLVQDNNKNTRPINIENDSIPPKKVIRINVVMKKSSASVPGQDRSQLCTSDNNDANMKWDITPCLETEYKDNEEEHTSVQEISQNRGTAPQPYGFMKNTFPCHAGKCRTIFYNQSDLDNHSKLHGTFKCSFCPVTKSFAPYLSLHELTKHGEINNIANLKEMELYSCAHCDYSVRRYRLKYIEHHLSSHMNLNPDRHTCPVCSWSCRLGSNANGLRPSILVRHFKKCHDVSEIDVEKISRCDAEGCLANFVKRRQLPLHKNVHHGDDEMDGKAYPKLIRVKVISKSSKP